MKTKIFHLIKRNAPILMAFLTLSFSASTAPPESDFQILKKRNGINLYYRWMQMPDGNKVRQMKAVLEINAETEELISLLKDENRAMNWVPGAEQYQNLKVVSGTEWVSYIQFSIPWPLADQDCILEFTSGQNNEGETVIDFHCNEEYISPVEGIKRMKDIDGSFVIRPLSDGSITLECYYETEELSA